MITLPNKVYDTLKWLTMVFLPALAVFYGSMGKVLDLPFPEKIPATIGALVVFLGIFLQVNSSVYRLKTAFQKGKELLTDVTLKLALSDSTYDTLKWIATIFLPGISTLYVAIAAIWGLSYGQEVSGTIAAIVVFMAALLQIAANEYRLTNFLVSGSKKKVQSPVIIPGGPLGLSQDTYDTLKFVAQALLPGVAAFYVALATIWNWPYPEAVSATIMAIVAFMNGLLQVSTAMFNAANKD